MMDLLEVHAREKIGAPESWTLFRYKCLPEHGKTQVYQLTGAVEIVDKNERSKWPEPHTEVYITPGEHDTWCAGWEQRTGLCRECQGEKVVTASISVKEGRLTRSCPVSRIGRNDSRSTTDQTPVRRKGEADARRSTCN